MNSRPLRSVSAVALVALAVFLLTPSTAQAYLDAGSASMLFQALVGAIAAGILISKGYWARIRSALGFSGRKADANEGSGE